MPGTSPCSMTPWRRATRRRTASATAWSSAPTSMQITIDAAAISSAASMPAATDVDVHVVGQDLAGQPEHEAVEHEHEHEPEDERVGQRQRRQHRRQHGVEDAEEQRDGQRRARRLERDAGGQPRADVDRGREDEQRGDESERAEYELHPVDRAVAQVRLRILDLLDGELLVGEHALVVQARQLLELLDGIGAPGRPAAARPGAPARRTPARLGAGPAGPSGWPAGATRGC